MTRTLACLLALAITLPAAAQIYTWRDKDGKIHYSDVPPATGEATTLRGAARPASPTPAEAEAGAEGDKASAQAAPSNKPKTLAERELEFRQRRAQAAEAEAKANKEKAAAEERAADCQRARNQLAALTSGQRMARYDASGERVVLDDAARAEEIARAQQYIADACQ